MARLVQSARRAVVPRADLAERARCIRDDMRHGVPCPAHVLLLLLFRLAWYLAVHVLRGKLILAWRHPQRNSACACSLQNQQHAAFFVKVLLVKGLLFSIYRTEFKSNLPMYRLEAFRRITVTQFLT